ncbi:MAG: RNA methyltransferase [Flavobacteriales bacterium]|nr:RNA methyltransferase [Flavobacteriales bacterium]
MALFASDIKLIRSLQQKKFRKEHSLFVVEGVKPVQELMSSTFKIHAVYATEPLDFLNEDFIHVSEKELGRISGLKSPNKVLALVQIPKTDSQKWQNSLILLLDGINDPGNLGTIIRTAKWFGVSEIICSTDCVDAYDRKVVQSTMGALFHVNLTYRNPLEAMNEAKQNGFTVLGTSMTGSSVYELETFEKTLLVIGSESHGMRENVSSACELLCTIPNFELNRKIESLNAGIATAILLSELTRKNIA